MKEKLLVLAKAAPIVSKKYDHLVCVAGITDRNEWRRIYPVPFELFWKGGGFKKKSWIEYELVDNKPSDNRPESRKIILDSIKRLEEDNYNKLHDLLESKLTSLEELSSRNHKEISLGVIKPNILDFYSNKNKHYSKLLMKKSQQTMSGKSVMKIDVPEKEFSYIFNCSKTCKKKHDILCEDWEVAELYRNCKNYQKIGKYPDEKTVLTKVKDRMFSDIKNKEEVYFIMGTHFIFGTYVIIGLVYPKKADRF